MADATHTAPATSNGTKPHSLAAKLIEAALDVENVEKRGRNTQQNYQYAMAEDIAAAATKALLARGVLCEFEVTEAQQLPITSKSGGSGLIVTVHGQLVLTDSESGESICREAMGSGSDFPGDKAIYKAMTGARKYAFIHLLGIPIGDDPDAHRAEAPRTRREMIGPKLEAERVKAITAEFKKRGMTLGDIDLLLGAVNIDALRARSKKAVVERIESLASEQADALEAEMEKANG